MLTLPMVRLIQYSRNSMSQGIIGEGKEGIRKTPYRGFFLVRTGRALESANGLGDKDVEGKDYAALHK